MFKNSSLLAFVINLILIIFCISSYPFLNFIIISGSLQIYKENANKHDIKDKELLGSFYSWFVILMNGIPLVITIFFPQIAVVRGYVGSTVGLFILYIIPVLTYLKKLRIEMKEGEIIEVNDEDFRNQGYTNKKEYLKECMFGACIIVYGFMIFIISIYNPFTKY